MRPRSGARVDYTMRVDTARLNRLPKTNEKPTFFDRLDPGWARLDLARLGLLSKPIEKPTKNHQFPIGWILDPSRNAPMAGGGWGWGVGAGVGDGGLANLFRDRPRRGAPI